MIMLHPYYKRPQRGIGTDGIKLAAAYLATGAIVTLTDYGIFGFLFSVLDAGLLGATVGAYCVGLIVSYLLNRYWVFRKGADRQSGAANMFRYVSFLIVNLVITYALLAALAAWFNLTPYIGKLAVNFFMIFWIYAGNRYWVFAGPNMGPIKL